MKNGEFDNYGIKNPDGAPAKATNDGKISFANDQSNYIGENASRNVRENLSVRENLFGGRTEAGRQSSNARPADSLGGAAPQGGMNVTNVANAATTVTSTAATTAATATSVTATLGSGLGTVAGVVASALVTAVIVVVTFLNILSTNISLVLADVDKLVFRMEVEVEETEDENAEMPVFSAVLTGEGDFRSEQTITPNELFTFDGLQPSKEYFLTVTGSDGKTYVEKSYCTAARPARTATINVSRSEESVTVSVEGISLSRGEIHTFTATDGQGRQIFVADGDRESATYTFRSDRAAVLSLTLRIGGKVIAAETLPALTEPEPILPVYLYERATWTWGSDHTAVASIPDERGGEPLLVDAVVEKVATVPPTCEESGSVTFRATITDEEGRLYVDDRTETLSAIGHEYLFDSFVWDGVSAIARYVCERDADHILSYDAVVTSEVTTPPTCEEAGVRLYKATYDGYFDVREVPIAAIGHEYGEPEFIWTPIYSSDAGTSFGSDDDAERTPMGYTAVARFTCRHDSAHYVDLEAQVSSIDNGATCTADAYRTYTASVVREGEIYSDDYVYTFEETALGHTGMELYGRVPATFEHGGNVEYWQCERCGGYFTDEAGEEEILDPFLPQLTSLDGKVFEPWNEEDTLPSEAGNYYLTSDISLAETWVIEADTEINLCLNGHVIDMEYCRFLDLGERAVFGLYECDDSEIHYYRINMDFYTAEIQSEEEHYLTMQNSDIPVGEIYGGYITGSFTQDSGGVIRAASGSVVNLNGGNILGNGSYNGDGGVYYSAKGVNATLNLNGTNLIGNIASVVNGPDGCEGSGGAVYSGSGVVNMTGGELLYNAAARAGTIRVPDPDFEGTGVFTMSGGRIAFSTNDYLYQSSLNDGFIVVRYGTFLMTGGRIEANDSRDSAVIFLEEGSESDLPYNGVFDMRGGVITENEGCFAVYVGGTDHVFRVSGDATISGNGAEALEADVYLEFGATITVTGVLTCEIGISLGESDEGSGIITSGYSDYHDGEEIVAFYAKYERQRMYIADGEIAIRELHEVYFDSNGGSYVPSQFLDDGEYAVVPEPPTWDDHEFLGWFEDGDGLVPFDFGSPITDYAYVCAKWRETGTTSAG